MSVKAIYPTLLSVWRIRPYRYRSAGGTSEIHPWCRSSPSARRDRTIRPENQPLVTPAFVRGLLVLQREPGRHQVPSRLRAGRSSGLPALRCPSWLREAVRSSAPTPPDLRLRGRDQGPLDRGPCPSTPSQPESCGRPEAPCGET